MAIGISKTFPMDLDLISRLLRFYGERPGVKPDEVGRAVGLNRPKIDGLNKLMGYLGLQHRRSLTLLGKLILENDKYLQDLGTLCVFHYLLCSNHDAEVWYYASSQFVPYHKRFTRDEFVRAIDEAGIGRGNTRLRADQSLFLNAYTSEDYQALQSLEYLTRLESRDEQYRAAAIERVPPLVLGFALYDRRMAGVQTQTISINNLLTLDGQVGKVFLFRREPLLGKLRQLEARGLLGITQVADLDNATCTQVDEPISLLADYYRERP
jgi:hypothetical protein